MEASLRLHAFINHPTSNDFPPSEHSAFPNINRGAFRRDHSGSKRFPVVSKQNVLNGTDNDFEGRNRRRVHVKKDMVQVGTSSETPLWCGL